MLTLFDVFILATGGISAELVGIVEAVVVLVVRTSTSIMVDTSSITP
jgi:hypothetical protein